MAEFMQAAGQEARPVLVSSDQPGRMVAHAGGVHNFPFTGMPAEVPDHVGAHLLGVGGFTAAGPPRDQGGGPMWLRKEQGGTEITYRKVVYAWPEDGSVAEVPPELGADLLSIRGAGYSVAKSPKPEEPEPEPEDGGGEEPDADAASGTDGGEFVKPSRSRSRTPKA